VRRENQVKSLARYKGTNLTPQAQRVLAVIDNFLATSFKSPEGRRGKRQVWDVLTALRGPDVATIAEKANTTSVIRTLAFPKHEKNGNTLAFFTDRESFPERIPLRGEDATKATKVVPYHFNNHMNKAAEALGLKTYYPNV
jgi:hypothetical protein